MAGCCFSSATCTMMFCLRRFLALASRPELMPSRAATSRCAIVCKAHMLPFTHVHITCVETAVQKGQQKCMPPRQVQRCLACSFTEPLSCPRGWVHAVITVMLNCNWICMTEPYSVMHTCGDTASCVMTEIQKPCCHA